MNWILNRLREPSTWAAISVIANAVGDHVATGTSLYGALAAGALAIVLREGGNSATSPSKN